MTKNTDIRGKQLLEPAGGKSLCIILSLRRTEMLLLDAVEVVAKLVHEDVQKHEPASLSLREPTQDPILLSVVRNTQPLKNLLMGLEIRRGNFHPKVIPPRVKKNASGLLTMVEEIQTVTTITGTRQDNALQSLSEAMPL